MKGDPCESHSVPRVEISSSTCKIGTGFRSFPPRSHASLHQERSSGRETTSSLRRLSMDSGNLPCVESVSVEFVQREAQGSHHAADRMA